MPAELPLYMCLRIINPVAFKYLASLTDLPNTPQNLPRGKLLINSLLDKPSNDWVIRLSRVKLRIFGKSYDIRLLVKEGRLTIINLSEIIREVATLFVADILHRLFEARKRKIILPTVVVLEEAHNYVSTEETPSSVMIRELIRGARHHGIGVWLISQRLAGIHRDAINIANTHIFLRLKGTDLDYVETFASLTREEIAEIPNLPDGVALVTGPIIRGGQGIKVVVRERRTKHGGHSISFVESVSKSLSGGSLKPEPKRTIQPIPSRGVKGDELREASLLRFLSGKNSASTLSTSLSWRSSAENTTKP